MMTDKPYSASCDRNRDPILAVLRDYFADRRRVLEIGSGTGQHAAYLARQLPHLLWQASDRAENLAAIQAWICDAGPVDALPPIELDVANGPWPSARYDAVFSANTLHIMGWPEVEAMFRALPTVASPGAKLAIYGPFNYGGKPTSASNAEFDRSLRSRAAQMGVRDFEAVNALARQAGFEAIDDVAMPANNRCLLWRRSAA